MHTAIWTHDPVHHSGESATHPRPTAESRMMQTMQHEPACAPDQPAFLRGGGDIGRLIRATPAPVLHDIGLPGMNGHEVCPLAGMAVEPR